MKTREQYEDIIHDMVASMLPNFKKSNIRPSYQFKEGFMGENDLQQDRNDGLKTFTNTSNFIYFTVYLDKDSLRSTEEADGKLSITRSIEVTFSVYGKNSSNITLIISALVNTYPIQSYLNNYGLYLYNDNEGKSTPMYEEINGQYWERHDYTIVLQESIKLVEATIYTQAANKELSYVINGVEL